MFADYFTVLVRTGGAGHKGLSFLLIERNMPGVETKQMQCTGVWASGTAFVTFDNVKVPVENIIGVENDGFKYSMCVLLLCLCCRCALTHAFGTDCGVQFFVCTLRLYWDTRWCQPQSRSSLLPPLPGRINFGHERWGFIVQANRFSRVCLEDALKCGKHLSSVPTLLFCLSCSPLVRDSLVCSRALTMFDFRIETPIIRYAMKRKTFGKPLVEHPVIRRATTHGGSRRRRPTQLLIATPATRSRDAVGEESVTHRATDSPTSRALLT